MDEQTLKLLGYVMLLIGVADIAASSLVFGKKLKAMQEKRLNAVAPDEIAKLDSRIKSLGIVAFVKKIVGLALIIAGAYIITK